MHRFTLLFGALLSLLGYVDAQNITITPANSTDYAPTSDYQTLYLATNGYRTFINPLTPEALSVLPNATNSPNGRDGTVQYAGPTTSGSLAPLSASNIAFISCDPTAYVGYISFSTVFENAVTANVSSIVFYSLEQPYCSLNGSYNFPYLYTMNSTGASRYVLSRLTTPGYSSANQRLATIITMHAYSIGNGYSFGAGSGTTAIAMIILYSVTGVISALFLAVIISGTIRAHRHPERYGVINVLGRPRQSKAKGLARAMLETLPIVKFGDKVENKPEDVELGTAPAITPAANTVNRTSKQTDAETSHEVVPTPLADGAADPIAAAGASRAAVDDTDAENPMCSICTDDFEKGQDIRVLPCDHKFHAACVDPWLLDVSGTCPLCRVDLRGHDADDAVDGNASNLAPPVASDSPTSRRSRLRSLFDMASLQTLSTEERLAALRRFRQDNAARQPGEARGNDGSWSRLGGGWYRSRRAPDQARP